MVTPTPTTVQVKMQLRGDTAANWASVNPVLLAREVGLETDTKKVKVGDGTTAWNSLAYFPSIVSGGTVLGNLEIGTTGTLTFEGSTADGFETTLAVTDPTADRTITLPDQSGTVVVTGNASIVDADIAANAEIAVSKLADGAARQLLQTDAAGTGVEWTDNVDVPGTLDVTGAATFDDDVTIEGDLTVNGTTTTIDTETLLVKDKNIELAVVDTPTDTTADGGGITLKGATDKTINWIDATDAWTSSERFSYPLGSAASPSLTFTGDENSGVYSPGADQLAISTNGSERLRIDSNGVITASNTGAPENFIFSIENPTTTASVGTAALMFRLSQSGGTLKRAASISAFKTNTWGSNASTSSALSFETLNANVPSEKLRITSDGKLGLGTSSPAALLHLSKSGTGDYTTVRLSNTGASGRTYEIGLGGNTAAAGFANNLYFYDSTAATTRMVIDSSGRVGIGTTAPQTSLVISNAGANGLEISPSASAGAASLIQSYNRSTSAYSILNYAGLQHVFTDGATERARIDSSGRLLVGTSSSSVGNTAVFQGNSSGSAFGAILNLAVGSASPTNGQELGILSFSDSGHDRAAEILAARDGGTWTSNSSQPTRLVFSTTADGASSPTERMRIDSTGTVSIADGIPNTSYFLNIPYNPGTKGCVYLENFAYYSSQHALVINDLDTNNARTMSDVRFERNGTEVGFIKINPSSVTYSTTSDYRVKENVVPLTGAIERLKQLKVRRFNFILDPERTVDGFIAHEAQTVVPEAVSGFKDETKDLGDITDASGNVIATAVDEPLPEHIKDGHTWTKTHSIDVHQGIDQAKLVPLLTAALQEALQKIETLEQRLNDAGIA